MEEALNRLRSRVPKPPDGAVAERDGPIVRTHYGTHGEVSHGPLPEAGLDALIARQVEAFARRNEPVVWPVYGCDTGLAERLRAAGFAAEPARAVLVRPIGTDRADEWMGPDRATGRPAACLLTQTLVDAADPAFADPAKFVGPVYDEVTAAGLAAQRLAEASGDLQAAFEAAGMRAITTVARHRLAAPGEPARTRPVRALFHDPEHDDIRSRFEERFAFRPHPRTFPGITEPAHSATWRVGDLDDRQLDALLDIVHKGLRASVEPGEELYWLDWHHVGYRFDPARVGGAGPQWPGAVFPDGDYYSYLTGDLRLGTFGHPWEATVCVFGDLLTRIGAELTAALGEPVRRSEA